MHPKSASLLLYISNSIHKKMSPERYCSLKVCGVTLPEQAEALKRLGVDFLGLNFHPKSPRYVTPEQARRLVEAWGEPSSVVGVFVDRTAAEILALKDAVGFGIAQLHGEETARTVVEVASKMPVIRAFRIRDEQSIVNAREHIRQIEAETGNLLAALIDGYSAAAHGGTGVTVSRSLIQSSIDLHPRLILAGGLNPDNLAERLGWIRPWAIDVASGVESSPGVKDINAVQRMIQLISETKPQNDICN